MVSQDELSSIEGFDDNLSSELINRAKVCLEKIKNENLVLLKKDGVDEYLLNQKDLTTEQLLKLKENNIKNRDQLADLSSYELLEIITDIESKKAEEIIIES